jgi:glycosyltransferase involved in cell wall biosynthesis
MRPEKNHLQLVDAVARLRRRGIAARALLIGDGAMREAVLACAWRLGVDRDVIVTGFRPDVRPYVRACDTMVLCSLRTEALSLAALEAMALHRPVVLSDVGGAPELVVPGHNGFLFPPGNTDALVGSLTRLRDRTLAQRFGAASRRRVEAHFSEATMVARYAQLLRTLGRRATGPAPVLGQGHGR